MFIAFLLFLLYFPSEFIDEGVGIALAFLEGEEYIF